MNRRNFLKFSGGATVVALSPSIITAAVPDVIGPLRNFKMAFPFQGMTRGLNQSLMQVHILNTIPPSESRSGKLNITINTRISKAGMETLDFDDILNDLPKYSETYNDIPNAETMIFSMIRCSNRIAKTTRRGRGNRYFILPDGVVVFYIGDSGVDAPVIRTPNGNILNDKYRDYFVKIDCDPLILTKKTVDILATQGILKADETNRNYMTESYMRMDSVDPYNVKPEKENTPELS